MEIYASICTYINMYVHICITTEMRTILNILLDVVLYAGHTNLINESTLILILLLELWLSIQLH